VLGPTVFKWFRVTSQLGRGMAFGSASHAIGTSKAKEFDELTVSISSVAMTLSAILGSSFAALIVWLFNI
ncbi:MAG: LrgB family protein, partial [Bacillus sp. (in: firmicutes)]